MNVMSQTECLSDWTATLNDTLAVFGHRNWVVVADAAYPAQARPGIETIVAAADHFEVVRTVFDAIAASSHLHANIYTDLELSFVAEEDAPGVSEWRTQLESIIAESVAKRIAHEEIIARLDTCAQLFKILVVKTRLTIPYSSVFFELDCGYWTVDAEERLRRAM
jgi:L-fucose mutarotase/ribose pyranase (RbsD/FucU family)